MLAEMFEKFLSPEVVWFVIGFILMIAEMMVPGLVILFFGLGAVLTGTCCLIFDLSLNTQLIIFLVSSVVSLILLRSMVKKVFTGKEAIQGVDIPAGVSDYLGSKCKVISRIDSQLNGKVLLNGSEWKAKSESVIEEGAIVEIIGQDSITFIVKEV